MKKIFMVVVTAVLMLVARVAVAADLPSALVDPFLHVQTALASDQFAGLAAHAKAIETAAAALGKDADAIVAGAKKLGVAKDIATARSVFGDMSAALVAYAEKTKSGFGAGVRVAYCPMADKPWIQKDKEIKNPYYGSSMLTCGSFKN